MWKCKNFAITQNMKNIKNTENIENIGRGKGGWENPLYTLSTRSPIRFQTPYNTYLDPFHLLLVSFAFGIWGFQRSETLAPSLPKLREMQD